MVKVTAPAVNKGFYFVSRLKS